MTILSLRDLQAATETAAETAHVFIPRWQFWLDAENFEVICNAGKSSWWYQLLGFVNASDSEVIDS